LLKSNSCLEWIIVDTKQPTNIYVLTPDRETRWQSRLRVYKYCILNSFVKQSKTKDKNNNVPWVPLGFYSFMNYHLCSNMERKWSAIDIATKQKNHPRYCMLGKMYRKLFSIKIHRIELIARYSTYKCNQC